MGVHPTATTFGLVADEYERGRPGYPQEAVAWLVEHAGLDGGSVVVDVAAGTGKLTRRLVPMVGRVVAVEPSDGMRSTLAAAVPAAEAVNATADHLPLADGAAAAVTVAQAFHWFAHDEALAEFQRVVGPGGRLAIVYNRRDLEQPLQRRLEEIVSRHRGDRDAERPLRPLARGDRRHYPVHAGRGGVVPQPGRDDRGNAGRPGGVDQHHRVAARRRASGGPGRGSCAGRRGARAVPARARHRGTALPRQLDGAADDAA